MSDVIEAVHGTLRELQDVLAADDVPLGSPALQEHRLRHAKAIRAARAAMRRDLGQGS
ncbi:hypothetical protein ABZT06_23845 [Streptomyces sp. NPDC005483]|uniref:hypothetical protein n=1 Tax=Streptomyces sp. NPDC005483 TaxID=3154882 RepID=UPI0033AC162E